MGRLDIPKIEASGNVIEFGYPLDNARSWVEPMESTEQVVAPSGVRAAWVTRQEPRLRGDVRWIPTSDATTPAGDPITGWDGADGWRWFLEHARAMNTFEFFPDRSVASSITSYLVDPLKGEPDLDEDGTRTFTLVIAAESASDRYTGY